MATRMGASQMRNGNLGPRTVRVNWAAGETLWTKARQQGLWRKRRAGLAGLALDGAQVAIEQRHAGTAHEHNQDGTGNQPANVGPPGHLIDRADEHHNDL